MGRLIDTDSLKDRVSGYTLNEDEYRRFCEIIDTEPIAFDLDRAVEQLEKEKNPLYREDGSLMSERTMIGIDKAIEIVKGGGVDA